MIAYTIQLFPFENVHDAISIDIIEKLVKYISCSLAIISLRKKHILLSAVHNPAATITTLPTVSMAKCLCFRWL